MPAMKHVWNQPSIQHAIPALRIWNFLSANAADLTAHITVNDTPHKGHSGNIAHAIANEKSGYCYRGCRQQKSIDLFGKMLTIRIQEDHPGDLSILSAGRWIRTAKPVRETRLNCFAFALVLRVNNNFGAGFACALGCLIG